MSGWAEPLTDMAEESLGERKGGECTQLYCNWEQPWAVGEGDEESR